MGVARLLPGQFCLNHLGFSRRDLGVRSANRHLIPLLGRCPHRRLCRAQVGLGGRHVLFCRAVQKVIQLGLSAGQGCLGRRHIFVRGACAQFGQIGLLNGQILLGRADRALQGIGVQLHQEIPGRHLVAHLNQNTFDLAGDSQRQGGFSLRHQLAAGAGYRR